MRYGMIGKELAVDFYLIVCTKFTIVWRRALVVLELC